MDDVTMIHRVITVCANVSVYAIYVLSGMICLRWLIPFVRVRKAAYAASWVYTGTIVALSLLYDLILKDTEPPDVLKLVPIALVYIMLCVLDRRNYLQKLFLTATFMVLRFLVLGLFAELSFFERDFIFSFDLFTNSIPAMMAEFVVWQIIWTLGITALLYAAVCILLRAYRLKSSEMTLQELLMLLVPMLALMSVRHLVSLYFDLWGEGIVNGTIEKNIPGDVYRLIFYILSLAAIMTLITLYQGIRVRQEDAECLKVLERQIADNREYMGQIEQLYGDIRATWEIMWPPLRI